MIALGAELPDCFENRVIREQVCFYKALTVAQKYLAQLAGRRCGPARHGGIGPGAGIAAGAAGGGAAGRAGRNTRRCA